MTTFRDFILLNEANELQQFVKGGKINLYHFLGGSIYIKAPSEIVLNPNKFGTNSFTRNDMKAASKPRVFFYVDLTDKEFFFGSKPLYKATVPVRSIYNLLEDPDGIKEMVREKNQGVINFQVLLNSVHKAGYKGVYYKSQIKVVNWFEPIKAKLVNEKEEMQKFILGKTA